MWVSRANYARHVRTCGGVQAVGVLGLGGGDRLGW